MGFSNNLPIDVFSIYNLPITSSSDFSMSLEQRDTATIPELNYINVVSEWNP